MMFLTIEVTEAEAHTILAAAAYLSDENPLKNKIITAIAFARRRQSMEGQEKLADLYAGVPWGYVETRED